MLNRLAKEIASEIVAKKKDPEYKAILSKGDCVRRLSIIMDKSQSDIENQMDKKITSYLKSPELYR